MALIFAKTATDNCLTLDQRQALIYPFAAPGWVLLRLGLWLSLTGPVGLDDYLGSLNENLGPATGVGDRWWMGLKDNGNVLPNSAATDFCGFFPTNIAVPGSSVLTENTPDTNYRYANATSANVTGGAVSAATVQFAGGNTPNNRIKFPNVNSIASGYSSFFGVAVQRTLPSSADHTVALSCPSDGAGGGGNAGNNVFTSTPTIASLRIQMRTLTFGTFSTALTLSSSTALGAIYLYWPFFGSRLRIHALALEQY